MIAEKGNAIMKGEARQRMAAYKGEERRSAYEAVMLLMLGGDRSCGS